MKRKIYNRFNFPISKRFDPGINFILWDKVSPDEVQYKITYEPNGYSVGKVIGIIRIKRVQFGRASRLFQITYGQIGTKDHNEKFRKWTENIFDAGERYVNLDSAFEIIGYLVYEGLQRDGEI